jgi:hypothetical protein
MGFVARLLVQFGVVFAEVEAGDDEVSFEAWFHAFTPT